jgi:protein-S-isoprenylcysteine O-methyltransferase Ste14
LALIAIVIASWLLYRYFAPKTRRELYRAQREKRLATDGLYGLVRHPQYTGLFIGLFGEGGSSRWRA